MAGPGRPRKNPLPEGEEAPPATIDDLTPEQQQELALQILQKLNPGAHAAVVQYTADAEEAEHVEKQFASEWEKQRAEPHVWIEVNRMGENDTETEVFVGAAGVDYKLKKEVKIPVPQSVIEVLNNAVITGFVKVIDERTGQPFLRRVKYKRYPFSTFGMVSQDDLEKWRAEQDRQAKAKEQANLGEDAVRAALKEEDEPSFVPAYLQH